jgi:hypothetical protein
MIFGQIPVGKSKDLISPKKLNKDLVYVTVLEYCFHEIVEIAGNQLFPCRIV